MKDLIENLQEFAKLDFPVHKVNSYLLQYQLHEKDKIKYCHFSEKNYTRNLVYRNNDFEILFLCWSPEQIAPVHGHEGEKCWAKVESGKLQFCNYSLLSKKPLKLRSEKSIIGKAGYLDGPAEIHSVENIFKKNAISLHIYARPYDACDIYNFNTKSIDRVNLKYYSKFGELC